MNTDMIAMPPSPAISMLDTSKLDVMVRAAELMSQAVVMVPDHFKGKPADCLAVVMQADQWGMNPFTVAQKTHLVSGTLGYESQLVNAVISSSKAIKGRFHYEWSDGWERLAGKVQYVKESRQRKGQQGSYQVTVAKPTWKPEDEQGLWVRCGAVLAGEKDITWGPKLYLASVLVRNSELWTTKPYQQAAYTALKDWSRLYTPAVMQGVYDREELEPHGEIDITPVKTPRPQPGEPSIDDLMGGMSPEMPEKPEATVEPDSIETTEMDFIPPNPFEQFQDRMVDIASRDDYKLMADELRQALSANTITQDEFEELAKIMTSIFESFQETT